MGAVAGGAEPALVCLGHHVRVDVPAPEGPRLDVLGPKRLGQRHRARDVPAVGLGLDPAALFFIEGQSQNWNPP